MRIPLFLGFLLLALGGCNAVPGATPAQQTAAPGAWAYEYRIASIEREVVDLTYTRSRSISFRGKIEFTQTAGTEQDVILYATLRTETQAGTDENDLVVLMRDGRGEYEGTLRYINDQPLNEAAPELRADQVTLTILGVVPLEQATLTNTTPSTAAASAPPATQ